MYVQFKSFVLRSASIGNYKFELSENFKSEMFQSPAFFQFFEWKCLKSTEFFLCTLFKKPTNLLNFVFFHKKTLHHIRETWDSLCTYWTVATPLQVPACSLARAPTSGKVRPSTSGKWWPTCVRRVNPTYPVLGVKPWLRETTT